VSGRGAPAAAGPAVLLEAAAAGDQAAWDAIVDRFSGLVWATARAHRLSRDDAADVAQTTWLRLVEHLDAIREPDRLGAWLATTARRESLRVLRRGSRERPTGEADLFEEPSDEAIDRLLLDRERDGALWRAFAALTDRCKSLLRLLMADEEPTYEEIGAALGMPIGAIGPTRMRCLDRLRRSSEVMELAT
jgi:RNA polymerase sigma factor (sigma-70 family)